MDEGSPPDSTGVLSFGPKARSLPLLVTMSVIPTSLLGIALSGDCDGLTYYTRRDGRTVYFPAAPPACDPTLPQLIQRHRFARAARNWSAASVHTQDRYERASLRTGITMTGCNLWMHLSFSQDADLLLTITRQTGIPLEMPPPV